jgi:FkbM family methyltransferase
MLPRDSERHTMTHHAKAVVKCAINYRGQRREIFRRYVFGASRRITPFVGVEQGGIRFILPTRDTLVGLDTFIHGHYEIEKLAQALALAHKYGGKPLAGQDLLDIGANIGTTSIPAVKEHKAAHVWAFEPAPDNVRLLRCNIHLNDLSERITVVPVALSDHDGEADLGLSKMGGGDHRVMTSNEEGYFGESSWDRISVPVRRLDEMVDELGIDLSRVALAWLDTQGYEARILVGASGLTSSTVPVLTEYWPYGLRRNKSLDLFHDLVADRYSTVVDIGGSRPRICEAAKVASIAERYDGASYTDLLLVK